MNLCQKRTFSHLFPSIRALVITFLNGLFGSSTCVFLLFKYLYTQNIAELPTMFLCFTFMQFICYIRTFYLMPKESIPFKVSEISNYDFRNGIFFFVDLYGLFYQYVFLIYEYWIPAFSYKAKKVLKTETKEKESSFMNSFLSLLFGFNVLYFGALVVRWNYFVSR